MAQFVGYKTPFSSLKPTLVVCLFVCLFLYVVVARRLVFLSMLFVVCFVRDNSTHMYR